MHQPPTFCLFKDFTRSIYSSRHSAPPRSFRSVDHTPRPVPPDRSPYIFRVQLQTPVRKQEKGFDLRVAGVKKLCEAVRIRKRSLARQLGKATTTTRTLRRKRPSEDPGWGGWEFEV